MALRPVEPGAPTRQEEATADGERYAQLAEKPGAELQRPLPAVRLEVDPVNTARTTARLDLDRSRPIVVFCPGAGVRPGQALAGAAFRRARARAGRSRARRLA